MFLQKFRNIYNWLAKKLMDTMSLMIFANLKAIKYPLDSISSPKQHNEDEQEKDVNNDG